MGLRSRSGLCGHSCVSEMSARRNEAVQRTRGGDRESPRERVRIVWSEELPGEAGPQDKQGLNSLVPPGSPFHVVRQKAMCRVLETTFGNPGRLILSS